MPEGPNLQMDGMDGMDGWDGRLSPSASLLRAPYGANKQTQKSLQCHKRICKRTKSQSNGQKRRKHVYKAVEDEFWAVEEGDDSEDDDYVEEKVEEELEVIHERSRISFSSGGGVETILNLREWLKSPWQE